MNAYIIVSDQACSASHQPLPSPINSPLDSFSLPDPPRRDRHSHPASPLICEAQITSLSASHGGGGLLHSFFFFSLIIACPVGSVSATSTSAGGVN